MFSVKVCLFLTFITAFLFPWNIFFHSFTFNISVSYILSISFISRLSLGFISLTTLCLLTGAFSPQICNITTESNEVWIYHPTPGFLFVPPYLCSCQLDYIFLFHFPHCYRFIFIYIIFICFLLLQWLQWASLRDTSKSGRNWYFYLSQGIAGTLPSYSVCSWTSTGKTSQELVKIAKFPAPPQTFWSKSTI